ncbi:pirin family protein [Aestuariimicrobium ganziense]|uniref:pirin family protein n=1 Tax=Aestuariimicrobium ganziense TaxID=2773677 RepID=UPI00194105CE|nr:pirin family protein [Aestuariimicrobium ganziense]
MQILTPREVPLGGYRAMTVRRTLPQRGRAFIGAWCFADHYGPARHQMDVAPHPHTGLQTVSWLFEGTIEHRDSLGTHELVRPGELNLMTAGGGICHSEVSTPDTQTLHGVQLWVALPDSTRNGDRAFEHHAPDLVDLDAGAHARVLIGDLPGVDRSPVQGHTPLLGAELTLPAGADLTLRLEPDFEHGILVDTGEVAVDDARVTSGEMAHLDVGRGELRLTSDDGARVMLLGGTPFEEEVIMWWNFLGRSHDEVVAFRDEWNNHGERYGEVHGYTPHEGGLARIPAPGLPGLRLLPTVRRGRRESVL